MYSTDLKDYSPDDLLYIKNTAEKRHALDPVSRDYHRRGQVSDSNPVMGEILPQYPWSFNDQSIYYQIQESVPTLHNSVAIINNAKLYSLLPL